MRASGPAQRSPSEGGDRRDAGVVEQRVDKAGVGRSKLKIDERRQRVACLGILCPGRVGRRHARGDKQGHADGGLGDDQDVERPVRPSVAAQKASAERGGASGRSPSAVNAGASVEAVPTRSAIPIE